MGILAAGAAQPDFRSAQAALVGPQRREMALGTQRQQPTIWQPEGSWLGTTTVAPPNGRYMASGPEREKCRPRVSLYYYTSFPLC